MNFLGKKPINLPMKKKVEDMDKKRQKRTKGRCLS